MFFIFVRGIGNFGGSPERRKAPNFVKGSFGHTGNYLIDDDRLRKLNAWLASTPDSWYAKLTQTEMTKLVETGKKEWNILLGNNYDEEKWPRLIAPDRQTRCTLGAVFAARIDGQKRFEEHLPLRKLTLGNVDALLILKWEVMNGNKLDQKNRKPWGQVSKPFGNEATARSMRSIKGLYDLFIRSSSK